MLGKPQEVRLAFVALLSGGHLLIEDLPGLGKTTLAHALAATLGLGFQRVQFTSDLLPADVLGVSVYDAQSRQFQFHPGPVFTHVLLADEINRAPPRTQSALLEAMAEHQVTLDGMTRPLPDPFFVIATQNPVDLAGTYPLPDSQLDRFLLRLTLGYPNAEAERALLAGTDRRELIAQATPLLSDADVLALRAAVSAVHASEALVDYVQALLTRSRQHPGVRVGLSPRAGLALLRAARAMRCCWDGSMWCRKTCRRCSPPSPRIAWSPRRKRRPRRRWPRPSCMRWRWTDRHAADAARTPGRPRRAARAAAQQPKPCRCDSTGAGSTCCRRASACSSPPCCWPCCWAR